MFDALLKLYGSNSKNTPLEDFTTEAFVGVLSYDSNLKKEFISKYLHSESENLKVETQQRFKLENYPDCIVDIVIQNDKEIYFIENKVNSEEGYMQLERYSLVLDEYQKKGFKTKLLYCTKVYDKKKHSKHNFHQFSWHDLSKFIELNATEQISADFVSYLKNNGMSTNMTLKNEYLITMKNMSNVFSLIDRNLDNVLDEFSSKFPIINDLRKGNRLKEQLLWHNRYCILSHPIIKGGGWTEMLFGFNMSGEIFTQIFVSEDNPNFNCFKNSAILNPEFQFEAFDGVGGRVYLTKDLAGFINDEESEPKIKKWFQNSFALMLGFIKANPKIEWININQ